MIKLKRFSDREKVPKYIAEEVDKDGVVVEYEGKWRIISKKQKPYEFWDAKYDTKKDAEDALSAYHANRTYANADATSSKRRNELKKKIKSTSLYNDEEADILAGKLADITQDRSLIPILNSFLKELRNDLDRSGRSISSINANKVSIYLNDKEDYSIDYIYNP